MTAFDCNGNGRIDFADVVWLFNNIQITSLPLSIRPSPLTDCVRSGMRAGGRDCDHTRIPGVGAHSAHQ